MKYRVLFIILTGVLLGFLVVLQTRSFGDVKDIIRRDSRADIFREIQILKNTNRDLEEAILLLETRFAQVSDQEEALKAIKDEIVRDKIIAGHVDISGPGIEMMVKQNIPLFWLTDIVNELFSGGAEAVSINNIRLTSATIGFDTLPNGQVSLNGVILAIPFHFQAIGDKKVLSKALNQPAGIVQRLKESLPNIEVNVDQKDYITMKKII